MPDALIDLRGKRGLILGIANDRTGNVGCVDAGYRVMG